MKKTKLFILKNKESIYFNLKKKNQNHKINIIKRPKL